MDETRTAAELEQYRVRVIALAVMGGAFVVAVVLVALTAYTVAAATTVIGAIAWWWAARMYADLRAQEMQRQAMQNARKRFDGAPPPAPTRDPYEG